MPNTCVLSWKNGLDICLGRGYTYGMNNLNDELTTNELAQLTESVNLLRQALSEYICLINFTKSDGTERQMYCTLRSDCLPPRTIEQAAESYKRQKEQRPRPLTNISVWDLEKDGWRSFDMNNLTSFVVGVEYPPNKSENV